LPNKNRITGLPKREREREREKAYNKNPEQTAG
jgi:hypothetical protein